MQADAKELNLGKSGVSYPNFKLTLNYTLTDNGVKVTIPNDSISFNEDFPLLRISLLPYFGADEASETANGYLFIPDGSGAVINMNQNEPNRRTIITGKVYGENASELPKEEATEKTEQYYLPVFGTVRNNNSAIFGIITNGDANSEITALLGRPNGNYYTVYPEFIIADYEKYTRCKKESVASFLSELQKRSIDTWLRQVIVKGINDSVESVKYLYDVADVHSCVKKVELLKFRKLCAPKYVNLGIEFPFGEKPETTAADISAIMTAIGKV